MLALDGARLRRSLAMTKQDCSDRYQLPPPLSRASPTVPMARKWPGGESKVESAGSVRTIGHDPLIIVSVLANERFPRQPVIRIVDPHAVVLVRENYI